MSSVVWKKNIMALLMSVCILFSGFAVTSVSAQHHHHRKAKRIGIGAAIGAGAGGLIGGRKGALIGAGAGAGGGYLYHRHKQAQAKRHRVHTRR